MIDKKDKISKEYFVNITPLSKIVIGDCLEKMKLLPDRSIDLIITDPPYNLGLFMKNRGTNMAQL